MAGLTLSNQMLHRPAPVIDKLPRPRKGGEAMAATRYFYEKMADGYAELALSLSMAPELARFQALCPPGRVVDLGCGAGRDLRDLTAAGVDATSLDLSEPLARKARMVSGAPVVVADLRRLPFAAGIFSGVWASASLLHLTRVQAPAALDEAARILQTGGVMFSSMKAGRGEHQSKDGRRFVLHTREDWGSMVEASGFRLISLEAAEGSSTARTEPETWIICFAERL